MGGSYPKKVNFPSIQQFPSFSIFGHMTWFRQKKTSIFTFGEKTFCSRSPSERYCQSFICSEHTFDPGLKPLEQAFMGYQPCRTVLVCPEASQHNATAFGHQTKKIANTNLKRLRRSVLLKPLNDRLKTMIKVKIIYMHLFIIHLEILFIVLMWQSKKNPLIRKTH